MSDTSWTGAYLPAYKCSAGLRGALDADPLTDPVLDGSGRVRLRVAFHRFEDPVAYVTAMQAGMPASTEWFGALRPTHAGAAGAQVRYLVRVSVADAPAAIRFLATMEAVFFVEPWGDPEPQVDNAIWWLQSGVDPTLAPDDGTLFRYDTTAKLFARGVTGKGQVYGSMDGGHHPRRCELTYGPERSSVPNIAAVQPPAVLAPGDPRYIPTAKIIAWYAVTVDTPIDLQDPCLPDPALGWLHGSLTSAIAVADAYRRPAAVAGIETDDPFDDEAEDDAQGNIDLFGRLIDHHDGADGVAPGAQAVLQEVLFDNTFGGQPCSYWTLDNVLQQAYDTMPGVRVHNNSWGLPQGVFGYSADSVALDRQAWRLRDFLSVFAAGNYGVARPRTIDDEAHLKSGLSVGAVAGFTTAILNPQPLPAPSDTYSSYGHGPGWQYRVKPELVAPHGSVTLPPGTPPVDDPSQCSALARARPFGTSIAAPHVSGLALQVRQYFLDGYYPGGVPDPAAVNGFIPTNALLKATLINSARNLAGANTADDGTGGARGDRPTNGQGWGVPTLDDTLFFAGDPTQAADGERSFLLVLNDAPNGLESVGSLNDERERILAGAHPAIGDGEIHEYAVLVGTGEDLHVTLAWSDPAGSCSTGIGPDCGDPSCSYGGVPPLRNDLDLEVIGPDGTPAGVRVWRPSPGEDSADPTRLWSGAYSRLSPPGGPEDCEAGRPGCALDCLVVDYEHENFSAGPPFCDFKGRDRWNPVETVFIQRAMPGPPAPDFLPGLYVIRVLGFDVQGNCEPPTLAQPNWIDDDDGDTVPGGTFVCGGVTANELEFDCIDDQRQGYALVVSGDVTPLHGVAHFDASFYRCGDSARVVVRDADLVAGGSVTVTTTAGDAEVFALSPIGAQPGSFETPAFQVLDTSVAAVLPGDGVVSTGDDAVLTATYTDSSPSARTAFAHARVACRDVALDVTQAVIISGDCDGDGDLDYGELMHVSVPLTNARTTDVLDLSATPVPFDRGIEVVSVDPAIPLLPGLGSASIGFVVRLREGHQCGGGNIDLAFRIELAGADGFQDRVFVEGLPINCGEADLAGDVPDGIGGTEPLRIVRPNTVDLNLTWRHASAAGVYNVWRGSLASLRAGAYDHGIDAFGGACNLLPASPPGTNGVRALGDGEWFSGTLATSYYYLVSAESSCIDETLQCVLHGALGWSRIHPDPATGALTADVRRPLGSQGAPCDPASPPSCL